MMLESINQLIEISQRACPYICLLHYIHRIKRLEDRGPHTWEGEKDATKDINVHGELFDIPVECHARHRGLTRLRYFKNVDAVPFVYHRFVGAWVQFPTITMSPFTFQNIYMWILCYI